MVLSAAFLPASWIGVPIEGQARGFGAIVGAVMISRKKLVKLDDVVAGMVLSNAVVDSHGAVLLPAATALTDTMVRSLRRREIETVYVVNEDISEADMAAERERVQQRLTRLFRKCNSDRAGRALLQRITEYRLGELE